MRALHGIIIPVLSDAMDRSLALAAAMDVRGYGRSGDAPAALRRTTGTLVVVGLLGVCVGVYGLMDGTTRAFGVPLLLAGLVVAGAGFLLGGRNVTKSAYRPDRWRTTDIAVAACGIAAAAVLYLTSSVDAANLYPSLSPLRWPQLALLPAVGVLIGLLPAWIAPPPPSTAEATR
jgi:energy-coupling factor transport system permease protein